MEGTLVKGLGAKSDEKNIRKEHIKPTKAKALVTLVAQMTPLMFVFEMTFSRWKHT